jgi:hypothetical protein
VNVLTPDKVKEHALYTLAYRPGLTGHRLGVYWQDGVAGPVPGYMVKQMIGKMDFHVFDYPCDLDWQNAVPKRREAVAVKIEIPAPVSAMPDMREKPVVEAKPKAKKAKPKLKKKEK